MGRQTAIKIEKMICRKIVKTLLAVGMSVSVNDGEETVLKKSSSVTEIMKSVFSTDEDILIAYKDGVRIGAVYLIWGNAEDIITDYSIALDEVLRPALEYVDKLAA